MIDMTGKPVTKADVQQAQQAVRAALVKSLTQLPAELAVQLPNILRCLQELEQLK